MKDKRTIDFLNRAARQIEQERNLRGEGRPAFPDEKEKEYEIRVLRNNNILPNLYH